MVLFCMVPNNFAVFFFNVIVAKEKERKIFFQTKFLKKG